MGLRGRAGFLLPRIVRDSSGRFLIFPTGPSLCVDYSYLVDPSVCVAEVAQGVLRFFIGTIRTVKGLEAVPGARVPTKYPVINEIVSPAVSNRYLGGPCVTN